METIEIRAKRETIMAQRLYEIATVSGFIDILGFKFLIISFTVDKTDLVFLCARKLTP